MVFSWDEFVQVVSNSGTVVTAVATVFLWLVTRTLARETKRMANASAQPQIIAQIVPNKWSYMHADLEITNTGNATAFDIVVTFDPSLEPSFGNEPISVPFSNLNIIKPSQSFSGSVGDWNNFKNKNYNVKIEWKRNPKDKKKEMLSYNLSTNDYDGVSTLGARDPVIQIAEQVKKIREDWQGVSRSGRKISVDVYSSDDRRAENEAREEWRRQVRESEAKDMP